MKIILIILFLLFTNKSYALGGKVYSIKLDNNNWIKEMPHIYPTADFSGREWYCGAQSYVSTMWPDDHGVRKKLLMGAKLSKENKQKHLNTFKVFLRKVSTNKVNCPEGNDDYYETWIDYKNKTLGVFKVIKYDEWGCMIFQTLIQIKKDIKTNVAMVCQKSHGTFFDFLTVPKYFKVDKESIKRLNL